MRLSRSRTCARPHVHTHTIKRLRTAAGRSLYRDNINTLYRKVHTYVCAMIKHFTWISPPNGRSRRTNPPARPVQATDADRKRRRNKEEKNNVCTSMYTCGTSSDFSLFWCVSKTIRCITVCTPCTRCTCACTQEVAPSLTATAATFDCILLHAIVIIA